MEKALMTLCLAALLRPAVLVTALAEATRLLSPGTPLVAFAITDHEVALTIQVPRIPGLLAVAPACGAEGTAPLTVSLRMGADGRVSNLLQTSPWSDAGCGAAPEHTR